ncbi:MAG: WYL domain-containing protein [Clostridia bacterium]|nr:WYL domain-containing protein [Clostridia bacterium]
MAYSELIKNSDKIRDYMRDFYVYGFRSRSEFSQKSARSYDDERRRVESWLGDYMGFRQTEDGKNVFLSIDSRRSRHNPLFRAWKTRSFTDGDITLHFILFDILCSPEIERTVRELCDEIQNAYLPAGAALHGFDDSTVRKKLKEYVAEGIVQARKEGRAVYYSRVPDAEFDCTDALNYFSEVAPCGVIGSFLLDKVPPEDEVFSFKHHYITQTLDSEILCALFDAMRRKAEVTVRNVSQRTKELKEFRLVPLRILISVQSGRQHLMAYRIDTGAIMTLRIDYIQQVTVGEPFPQFDRLRKWGNRLQKHLWGVSAYIKRGETEHVEFTVYYDDNEQHIPQRLEREKRCGTVERLDAHHCRFCADVFDSNEMLPWMRTFICRITDLTMSNKEAERIFRADLEEMYRLYGLTEGGGGA